jgi:plastocyanin
MQRPRYGGHGDEETEKGKEKDARRTSIIGVLLSGAVLVLAACGEGVETQEGPGEERVIRVEALDSLAFEPDQVSVAAGDTVRFVVTNSGEAVHEFVLGPGIGADRT